MAMVLDVLASYVQNMLKEKMTDKAKMLLGVSGDIDDMSKKLGDLKNFLADADRRKITDQSVQTWVRDLKDAMYDAIDILDLCHLKTMESDAFQDKGCFSNLLSSIHIPLFDHVQFLNPLLFCIRSPQYSHDIGCRIKNLNQKLDGIKLRSATLNFINLNSYEVHSRTSEVISSHPGNRETSCELDKSSIVGEKIKEDTRNLVRLLTKNVEIHDKDRSNKIMVFAIVGVGGIGKTTLAQNIFNDEVIQQVFTKKIWLSVNHGFSKTELLNRAITEAGGENQLARSTLGALERTLKKALHGHKTLIIMDDIWNHEAWERVLKIPFINSVCHGSRVLITTRHEMVARGMMAEEPYHHVEKLEPKDAWLLLKKQVVRNENRAHVEMLKDIGLRIIEKCDGLPLAVKVMGGLLRQKRLRQVDWENVINDSLWSGPQMPNDLNYAIYLSFEDLHSDLKPCFLHYSLLPKSTFFSIHEIVGMWISEGFVFGDSHDLEELGRQYYDELIQRNLIEPYVGYFDQSFCNMHDVVRSFAQYVARDEALVAHYCDTDITDKLTSQKLIRLSLENKGSESNDTECCLPEAHISLRTLILVGHTKIKQCDSFLSLSSLRILHLESVNFDALADSLYQLKHLRYLSIRHSNTSMLPENIGDLKFLQHMSISTCQNLVKLPSSICTLQNMRFLNLHRTGINNIPEGFGGLTCLRKLYGFPAHTDGDQCSLEKLGHLSLLMELHIRLMENVSSSSFATQARLGEKNLRCMSLSWTSRLDYDGWLTKEQEQISETELRQTEDVFDELCPRPCLENLHIKGYFGQRLPRWMMATGVEHLRSLRILTMDGLACCTMLPDGLCQLFCLEFLQIVNAPCIKRVGLEFLQPNRQVGVAFPKLHELSFGGMVEWKEWEWEEQVTAMPSMEILKLDMCKLRHIPSGLAFQARSLKKLFIYDVKHLSHLENFPSVVHLDVFRNTDLERIINLPQLQKLVIVKCPKMKVLEGLPALQRITLEDYDMEEVPRYLEGVNPWHLLLYCSLSLLTSIAAVSSSPEWYKFNHIQHVKAYADDEGSPRTWYLFYTRDLFLFETNISRHAIAQACWDRTVLAYLTTCPAEDELTVGRGAYTDKHLPLCVRFRCNAHRHLFMWLRQACLHCNEVLGIASLSDQWIDAPRMTAGRGCLTKYGRQQQQNETINV